jgi:hypothetical protein
MPCCANPGIVGNPPGPDITFDRDAETAAGEIGLVAFAVHHAEIVGRARFRAAANSRRGVPSPSQVRIHEAGAEASGLPGGTIEGADPLLQALAQSRSVQVRRSGFHREGEAARNGWDGQATHRLRRAECALECDDADAPETEDLRVADEEPGAMAAGEHKLSWQSVRWEIQRSVAISGKISAVDHDPRLRMDIALETCPEPSAGGPKREAGAEERTRCRKGGGAPQYERSGIEDGRGMMSRAANGSRVRLESRCGCAGVRVCGCAGVRVSGCPGVRATGDVEGYATSVLRPGQPGRATIKHAMTP